MKKSIIGMFTALALSTCAAAPAFAEETCANPISAVLSKAAEKNHKVVEIRGEKPLQNMLEVINSSPPGGFTYEPNTVRLIFIMRVVETPRGDVGLFIEVDANDCITFGSPIPTVMLEGFLNATLGRSV